MGLEVADVGKWRLAQLAPTLVSAIATLARKLQKMQANYFVSPHYTLSIVNGQESYRTRRGFTINLGRCLSDYPDLQMNRI